MLHHGPSCLEGPITNTRTWWAFSEPTNPALPAPPLGWGESRMDNRFKDAHRGSPPIRTALVERVRREIAEGTYDTPEKWERALDRLLNRLDG